MNYGLYLSASGVLTAQYRQDVHANNLANSQTVGFKPDIPAIAARDAQGTDPSTPWDFRSALLDRIGGGAVAGPQRISMAQGSLQQTGRPLDAALEDENAFFVVGLGESGADGQSVRLTRDGRMAVVNGELVMQATGLPVLNTDDQPMAVQNGQPVEIAGDGRVMQNGNSIGRLQVTGVSDPSQLIKAGRDLLAFAGNQDPRTALASVSVKAGFTESSAVDPVRELMGLMSSTRAIELNANLIRFQDRMMGQSVSTFGRVA